MYILNSKCKIRPLTKDLRTLNSIYRSVNPYFDCCSLAWGKCSKKRVFLSNSEMYNYNIRRSKFDMHLSKPKGRDTLGDKSLRHVAGTSRRNNSPCVTGLISWKFVATNNRTNSNQFEFVRLIAATKLAKAAFSHRVYTSGNNLGQNINEPTRERHMVSHIELEIKLVHIPLHTRSLRVHRTGVVSQRLVLRVVHTE